MIKMSNKQKCRLGVCAAAALAAMTMMTGCAESAAEAAESTSSVVTAQEGTAKTDVSAAVTVTGKSTAFAEPDRATIDIGVSTINTSAKTAQKECQERIDAVKKALTDLGADEESISTSYYSMYPRYDYDTGDGSTITGYNVQATITVKDLTLDDVGDAIFAATNAGASEISDISYTSSRYDEVYDSALSAAQKDAERKAGVMAEAEGKRLGSLISVQEGYQDTSARYSSSRSSINAASAEDSGASISIDPGQLEIEAQVTSTWALED